MCEVFWGEFGGDGNTVTFGCGGERFFGSYMNGFR
jgi:hypothetical protein